MISAWQSIGLYKFGGEKSSSSKLEHSSMAPSCYGSGRRLYSDSWVKLQTRWRLLRRNGSILLLLARFKCTEGKRASSGVRTTEIVHFKVWGWGVALGGGRQPLDIEANNQINELLERCLWPGRSSPPIHALDIWTPRHSPLWRIMQTKSRSSERWIFLFIMTTMTHIKKKQSRDQRHQTGYLTLSMSSRREPRTGTQRECWVPFLWSHGIGSLKSEKTAAKVRVFVSTMTPQQFTAQVFTLANRSPHQDYGLTLKVMG